MRNSDIFSIGATGLTAAILLAAYTSDPQPAFLACSGLLAVLTVIKCGLAGGIR